MSAVPLVLAIVEGIVFAVAAVSVAYVFVFSLATLLPARTTASDESLRPHFLIVVPAYAEDRVVLATAQAALSQSYSGGRWDVCVVSDHMSAETDERLIAMGVRLVRATYADSTKGKALQAAMREAYDPSVHTHVLLLDADNIIRPDLLARLAPLCLPGRTAVQLHRCAKNTDTDIALLDAASEEINNTIFRSGHNRLGLPSALIGSGICFEAAWFAEAVGHLQTAGEDKELERQLLLDGHDVLFADDLPVLDEKVASRSNFGQQRRRWLAAQFWALGFMLRGLPLAFARRSSARRLAYLDKTLQQALVPRSLLMAITGVMAVATLVLAAAGLAPWATALRWIAADALLDTALLLAIPAHMRTARLAEAAAALPPLLWQMFLSLFRLRGASHHFIHTQHGQQ